MLNNISASSVKIFWIVCAILFTVFLPNPVIALVAGGAISLTLGNNTRSFTTKISKKALQLAVILLGFGIQFSVILKVGYSSIWITFIGITLTFIFGFILGKMFKIDKNLSILLSSGTAICGGSAIAAVAPAINAKEGETAVAMAVVFLLNAVGLVLFPFVAHAIGMNEVDFGLWAALAIHDTSSVVGAAASYGAVALAVGTTVKLTRALWILPVAFVMGKIANTESKPKFQWFLVGFLLAGLINSLLPYFSDIWQFLALSGKHLMAGTLFLIGAGLTRNELKNIGAKSLTMAIILWAIMSIISLIAISSGLWSIPADLFNI